MYTEFPSHIIELVPTITTHVDKLKAKRLVLDTLTLATMGWGKEVREAALRREVFEFISNLKSSGVTSLLIVEIPQGVDRISKFGFEEFIVDSILITRYLEYVADGVPWSISIRKMRRTAHGTDIYPLQITKRGIVVKKV
jgi:KaiC/GvpD/RAD55 family RecA-like ATPase